MLPVKIRMENFFWHVKSELKFDFRSALIVGVCGDDERRSNAAGKSSCMEALTFALFGQTRHKNADDVVKRGTQMCVVELWFEHEGLNYKIIRTRNVKNSKEELQFDQIVDDGRVRSLTGDTNKLTQAAILDAIKSNYEVFVNSSYFQQGVDLDFAKGTFASRQSLISSLLKLDQWNAYQKKAKKELDGWETKSLRLKDDLVLLKSAEAQLLVVKQQRAANDADVMALQAKEQTAQQQIRDLEQRSLLDKDKLAEAYKRQDLDRRIKHCELQMAEIVSSANSKKSTIRRFKEEAKLASETIEQLNVSISELLEVSSKPLEQTGSLEETIIGHRSNISNLTSQIENIRHHDICVACDRPWIDLKAKAIDLKNKEVEKTKFQSDLDQTEEKLRVVRAAHRKVAENNVEINALQSKRDRLTETISRNTDSIQALIIEMDGSKARYDDLKAQAVELKQHVAAMGDEVKADESDLVEKQEELRRLRGNLNAAIHTAGRLEQEEFLFQSDISKLASTGKDLDEANKKVGVFSKLVKAFGRDGVPAIIIDNVVDDLTRITNQWLAEFCVEPTYINFITQKKNTKGDWRETFDVEIITPSGISKYESLSGGEKFRVSFAIRLALSTLQARRMGGAVQILLLDEVSTSLDAAGLEVFVSLIKKIERTMKVLVITHDDKLKDEFDTIITVKRKPEGSFIER